MLVLFATTNHHFVRIPDANIFRVANMLRICANYNTVGQQCRYCLRRLLRICWLFTFVKGGGEAWSKKVFKVPRIVLCLESGSKQDCQPSSPICVGSLMRSSKLLDIKKLLKTRPSLPSMSFSQNNGYLALNLLL